jgi:hypothetical protein
LPFWSSLFCFFLGFGFFRPYHRPPLTGVSFMVSASLGCDEIGDSQTQISCRFSQCPMHGRSKASN